MVMNGLSRWEFAGRCRGLRSRVLVFMSVCVRGCLRRRRGGVWIARTAKIRLFCTGTTLGSFRSGRRTEPSRRRSGWW